MLLVPKLLIIDINGIISFGSRDPSSPFYRILYPHLFILKPNVKVAFDLLLSAEIPYVIATKQRGLSDGTLSSENFNDMVSFMERELIPNPKLGHLKLGRVYIEPIEKDKRKIFASILKDYPTLSPRDILVIDDSFRECFQAWRLGMRTKWTTDFYSIICGILRIVP